jgi:hypothetical protein
VGGGMKISIETAALIMELRTMKVPWGKLSAMFDMDAEKLRHEIRKAKNRRFADWGK